MCWDKYLKKDISSYAFPDIPKRQLAGAMRRYAKIEPRELVVGLIDRTIFQSGKTGFLATTVAFYWNMCGGAVNVGRIPYREIEPDSVSFEPGRYSLVSVADSRLFTDGAGQLIAGFLCDVAYQLRAEFVA